MDSLMNFLTNPVIDTLSLTLIHFIWQGVLIALLLKFTLGQIPARQSKLRYAVSLGAMVLNLLTPVATFLYLYQPEAASHTQALFNSEPVVATAGVMTPQVTVAPDTHWLSVVALIWMVGVLFLSLHWIRDVINTYLLPYRQVKAPSSELENLFQALKTQLKVWQPAVLRLSDKVDVPMVIGWLKPVVLLPANMVTGLNNEQLAMLLSHELAHVKRYDYVVNFLQSLVELLLFYHPCVKWVSKQIKSEREYCCDDIAIAHCGDALAYAHTLTDAEMLRPHNIPQLAMAASGGDLKKRIFRAVGHHHCNPESSGHWLAAFSAVLLVSGLLVTNEVVGMTQSKEKEKEKIIQALEKPLVIEKTPATITQVGSTQVAPTQIGSTQIGSAQSKSSEIKEAETQVAAPSKNQVLAQKMTRPASAQNEDTTTERPPQAQQSLLNEKREKPVETENTLAQKNLTKVKTAETVLTEQTAPTATEQPTSKEVEQEPLTEIAMDIRPHAVDLVPTSTETAAISQATEQTESTQVETEASQSNLPEQPVAQQTDVAASSELLTQPPEQALQVAKQQEAVEEPKVAAVAAPEILHSVTPYYPIKGMQRSLEDEVKVTFTVSKNGKIKNMQFAPGSHRYFRRSVKSALKQWRFKPAMENGEAVETQMTKEFSFTKPVNRTFFTTGSRLATR